jgi:hypothetical protein
MDAQAAAARMPGRRRAAKVLPRIGRSDRARLTEVASVGSLAPA